MAGNRMKKTHKKIACIAGIVAIAWIVSGGYTWKKNGGWNQNGKAGTESTKEKSTGTESGTQEQPQTERVIVKDTDYNSIDNTLYAWWFKRNDNHETSGCQEDYDITEYNAYYTVPVQDILDTLKEEGVPAAFFVTQTFIRDNIELTKRMKEEGHLVCNHTVTHPSMPSKSIEEQQKELLTCETYMKEATGYEMDLFFRPPRGEYSKRTLQMAKDLGYTTIFWSMAYLDYDVNNQPTPEHVIEHFNKYYHPGAIPLLHNVSKANHDALKAVITNLKKEGYSFGTLYDLVTE